jgi:hypothetical protein
MPETTAATGHAPLSLLALIESVAESAPPEGLTLGALIDRLGERAFGTALFALALPCCVPFLYLVPQIVALPMAALTVQMALGRAAPWLPERLAKRVIATDGLAAMAKGGRKYFGWAEKLTRPRLGFLAGPTAERLVGLVMSMFCVSILLPVPMTNTVPGFGVALAAYGLMEKDGLLVLLGLVIGTVWIGGLITLALFGVSLFV